MPIRSIPGKTDMVLLGDAVEYCLSFNREKRSVTMTTRTMTKLMMIMIKDGCHPKMIKIDMVAVRRHLLMTVLMMSRVEVQEVTETSGEDPLVTDQTGSLTVHEGIEIEVGVAGTTTEDVIVITTETGVGIETGEIVTKTRATCVGIVMGPMIAPQMMTMREMESMY